jgi:hypothetical protein
MLNNIYVRGAAHLKRIRSMCDVICMHVRTQLRVNKKRDLDILVAGGTMHAMKAAFGLAGKKRL